VEKGNSTVIEAGNGAAYQGLLHIVKAKCFRRKPILWTAFIGRIKLALAN
jgi:hypothetical protein